MSLSLLSFCDAVFKIRHEDRFLTYNTEEQRRVVYKYPIMPVQSHQRSFHRECLFIETPFRIGHLEFRCSNFLAYNNLWKAFYGQRLTAFGR